MSRMYDYVTRKDLMMLQIAIVKDLRGLKGRMDEVEAAYAELVEALAGGTGAGAAGVELGTGEADTTPPVT